MTDSFPDITTAVILSLKVGLWCAVGGLPIALPLGWILAKKKFPGKAVVSTLCLIPVVLPPVVTGFILLSVFGAEGSLGRWLASQGVTVPFTFSAAVIAAMTVGMPFYIMGARAAFESVDQRLEGFAMTCGLPPLKTFFKITLPLALPGIAGGAVLTFARALGEFGATIVLAGNMEGETRTIALAIYSLLEAPNGDQHIKTFMWISIGIAFLTLFAFEALIRWQKRRMEVL